MTVFYDTGPKSSEVYAALKEILALRQEDNLAELERIAEGANTGMLSLVPRPRRGGPGTYCTRMRQHFRDICRKIVRITLSKHVVMPRKRNADEISGKREVKDFPSQNKSCFQVVPSPKHLE